MRSCWANAGLGACRRLRSLDGTDKLRQDVMAQMNNPYMLRRRVTTAPRVSSKSLSGSLLIFSKLHG